MKKIFGMLMLATIAFVGCTTDEGIDSINDSVSIEASIDQPGSRVGFSSTGAFFWTVNDAIGVTTTQSASSFSKMSITAGNEGASTATFTTNYMAGEPSGYAVYPYNAGHKMSGTTLTYNFPASYEYTIEDNDYFVLDGSGNSFNPPMWSAIENGSVYFKHLGGVLCVKIADLPAGTDQTLTVTTSNKITGEFTADLAVATPVLTTSASDTDNVVTITYDNATEADRVFYIPVPTGVYENITVSFVAEGETVSIPFEDKTINARSLQRLQIGSGSIEGGEAAASVDAANKALEQGASNVVIADIAADAIDATIVIPEQATIDNEVSISIENIDFTGEIIIDEADDVTNPVAVLNVTLPEEAVENLVIDMPNTTVYVNGVIVNLTATTAENTLVVSEGTEITNLIVKAGNVEIEAGASIASIKRANDNTDEVTYVYYYDEADLADASIGEDIVTVLSINTLDAFKAFAAAVNAGNTYAGKTVMLGADINLNNEEWTPIGFNSNDEAGDEPYFSGTFDGKDHTISNLKIDVTDKGGVGLFGAVHNATIKNFTLNNVDIKAVESEGDPTNSSGAEGKKNYIVGGHMGAIAGYDAASGTLNFENVHVTGLIKIEGETRVAQGQRIGGIIGGRSSSKVNFKNVSVKGSEGSYIKGYCSTAGVMGQVQNTGTFEDVHTDIDIYAVTFGAGGIIGIARQGSTFTNCSSAGDITLDASKTQLSSYSANYPYRVGGIAGCWSESSTGVLTLTGCSYTGVLTSIDKDGNNVEALDYAGYVGRGYTLKNCAGSKVVIDGVSYVQADNTVYGVYTIDGVYEMNTLADMQWLANKVNTGADYFNGKTVKLANDIDLNNVEWTPIGSISVDHGFMGNFDGNNKTIKNLSITAIEPDTDGSVYAGLFGVTEGIDAANSNFIKNFTIENVNIELEGHIVAAAIAYPYYTDIDNITVKGDITIKGGDYTAGVLAYTRRCVDASNLTIEGNAGSTITGGTTVGGVISDIQMNGGLTANYSNFEASGLTILGTKCVGGISGIISAQTLDGATVKDIKVEGNGQVGIISGSMGSTSVIKNVSIDNVSGASAVIGGQYNSGKPIEAKIGDTYYATVNDAIAAAEAGDVIELVGDVVISNTITIAKDRVITLDLNGYTLSYTSDVPNSMIINNAQMTIKDSKGAGKISYTFNGTVDMGKAANAISNRGTLIVEGGAISNTGVGSQIGYAIDNYNGATLTVNGGDITASGSSYYDGIRLFCGSTQTTVTVNAGNVSTIWAQNPSANKATEVKGTVVINGGTIGTTYYENYTTVMVKSGVAANVKPYGAGNENTTSAESDGYTVYSFVH